MAQRLCLLIGLIVASLWLASCGSSSDGGVSPAPTVATLGPAPTDTPTPPPLAATVDGAPIALSLFEEEMARFEAAQAELGTSIATDGDSRNFVLQSLIDRVLLSQAAKARGVEISEEALSNRIDELAEQTGGSEALGGWLAANGYTLESFKVSLMEELLAAEMVNRIANSVESTTEQTHARHILVRTRTEAEELRAQALEGADFAELASIHSLDLSTRPGGGDLGWFPRSFLTMKSVEEAAFSVRPGEISEVVESELGFHVIQVVERGDHPLSPAAWRAMREKAVEQWLADARVEAEVQIFVSP